MQKVLITGGAGFIGSHVADELLAHGFAVRVLDTLAAQVHGDSGRRPDYLDPEVEVMVGDVNDRATLKKALKGMDAVYHLAAAVGVGQSMYEVAHYTRVNNLGTAVLLEELIANPVERLVLASSMSLYGEGLYRNGSGQLCVAGERSLDQLRSGDWELRGSDGSTLQPVPTPESKPPALASVYALSKFDQERMCLMIGRAYQLPVVALRFFNAYGPRQALSNPYTGVLAIFAARLLNDSPPKIFEDGLQQRDFVSVYDVARACRLALQTPQAAGEVFNVGSGQACTVRDIAARLARVLGKEALEPEILGKYRVGDIRHCFADIGKAREVLGFAPQVQLDEGMAELAAWLESQAAVDRVAQASAELSARGLTL
jgi:dTDP-L-rhamnose 4-epimerase